MNPDELFKRFFGSSPLFPEFRYRGYGHSNDDTSDQWSHGDHQREDIFGDWHQEFQKHMEDVDRQMREVFRIFRIADIPSIPALPDGSQDRATERNPRDFMLKDGHKDNIIRPPAAGEPESPVTIVPSHEEDELSALFEKFFNIPRWNRIRPQDRKDTDLDGETPSSSELADLFKEEEAKAQRPVKEPSQPWGFFGHNSVSVQTIVGADGVVEERRTVRDSSGREETTVTRRIGDRSHSVTTVTDDSGHMEKRETFQNVDKDKLSDFDHHWEGKKAITSPKQDEEGAAQNNPCQQNPPLSNDTRSIFRRLFGFSSK